MTSDNRREYRPGDTINPKHYRIDGRLECVDEQRQQWGDRAFTAHCEQTAWKYRYRVGLKDTESPEKDLGKARWYEQMALHVRGICADPRDDPWYIHPDWSTFYEKHGIKTRLPEIMRFDLVCDRCCNHFRYTLHDTYESIPGVRWINCRTCDKRQRVTLIEAKT